MDNQINIQELASQLRQKRGKRGLREIAAEIGEVSASTLSRVEQGKIPDLETFVRICRWLGVPMDTFTIENESAGQQSNTSEELGNQQILTVHLRADKTLNPETAKALKKLIELAYIALEQDEVIDDEE